LVRRFRANGHDGGGGNGLQTDFPVNQSFDTLVMPICLRPRIEPSELTILQTRRRLGIEKRNALTVDCFGQFAKQRQIIFSTTEVNLLCLFD
jgi:hypothetical protein